MSKSVVAKRYAVALFNLAKEQGQVEVVQADLNEIKTLFHNNKQLTNLLSNPKLSMAKKKALLANLFGEANQLIQNVLYVLLEKKRINETVNFVDAYTEFANEAAGVASAKVFSTRPLTDDEKNGISTAFAAKVGRKSLEIENIVDPTVLGGIRLQIGNRIYDSSLSGKLERLKRTLIGS